MPENPTPSGLLQPDAANNGNAGAGAIDALSLFRRLSSATVATSFQPSQRDQFGGQIYNRSNTNLANLATQLGYSAIGSGNRSTAVGSFAYAREDSAVALGVYALALGPSSVAIGDQALSSGYRSITIGNQGQGNALGAISIGFQARALGVNSIAIGSQAYAIGANAISIGASARTVAAYSIALGALASVPVSNSPGALAIGANANVTGAFGAAIALGAGATVLGTLSPAIAIGSNATVTSPGREGIAIGTNALVSARAAQAYGEATDAGFTDSIAFGRATVTTTSNQLQLGNSIFPLHGFIQRFENIRYADQFAGANAGAQIAAAIADLLTTGGIVNARAFEGAQTCTLNPFAGVTKPITLLLGAATISTSVAWTISAAEQHIHGLGMQSIIKASAAMAHVIKLDGSALTNGLQSTVIRKIRLDGNGLATDGLTLILAAGFQIDQVSVTNVTNAGFRALANPAGSAVTGLFIQPTVSSNVENFTTTPDVGIKFEDTGSSNNTIINGKFEGILTSSTGVGIWDNSQANIYIGGTTEGNKRGIKIGTGGSHRFDGLFLEQNTVYDIYTEGFLGEYSGMICTSAVANATEITAAAYLNKFFGGTYDRITNNSTFPNTFSDLTILTSFTDNGTGTIFRNVRDNSGPISPDNVDENPYQILTIYSSFAAVPTSFIVRAHASSQATTNLTEWRDASNTLRTAIAEDGFIETTKLNAPGAGNTLSLNPDTQGTVLIPFAGEGLTVGSTANMTTQIGATLNSGATRAIFGVNPSAGGLGFVGTDVDKPFSIITSGAIAMTFAATSEVVGKVALTGITESQLGLGSQTNGTIAYCTDCTIANPCAGGGTGALAKRLNGVWVCN